MTSCNGCANEYVNCNCSVQNVTVQVPAPIAVSVATGQGGARGPQGIQGIQGISGSVENVSYHHVQSTPSNTWTIAHNLNFYPNVTTMDSGGSIVEGEIEHLNRNTLRATFVSAFSGDAYLS